MRHVVANTPLDALPALLRRSKAMHLDEPLQYEARMEVIDKRPFPVNGIEPGAVGILRLDEEPHVSHRRLQVPFVLQLDGSPCQQRRAVGTGIDHKTKITGVW